MGRHSGRTRGNPRHNAALVLASVLLTGVSLIAMFGISHRPARPHLQQSTQQDVLAATRPLPIASVSPRTTPPPAASIAPTAPTAPATEPPTWLASVSAHDPGHLAAGSDPTVLPAAVLIADKLNNRLVVVDPAGRVRWTFPRPGDLAPGETFEIPDDAFFTPDGENIIATQEDQSVVTVIRVRTRRIIYRYGIPGVPGAGPNHLDNPDDAMVLPGGQILVPDIKNCRLIVIAPGGHAPLHTIGMNTTACQHAPPHRWGSPNGAFPESNGHYLITEINGDWVNDIALDGTVYWSTHAPGVSYPSDSNQIGPDRYLTVDYSTQGQVVIFNHNGKLLWRYGAGAGNSPLNHPSLAVGLPNGDILLNDDFNHRVVVIDPRTNKIVWQYGHTGAAGSDPGYLDNPDGLDLVPPHSLLMTHAHTMTSWH